MTKDNKHLMEIYRGLIINRGLTQASIEAKVDIDIRLYLDWLGDKPLTDATHHDIAAFITYLRVERNNAKATINRKLSSLNNFYETLIRQEYIDIKNPMDKIDKIKAEKKLRGYITAEEYRKMMNYARDNKDLRGQALMSLLFSSGIRLSEVYQLNRDALDYTKKQFKVFGKGQKWRRVIFSEEAGECIQRYLSSRKDNLPPMFISRENNRWSKKGIQDYVKQVGKAAGLNKNIHPHLFRHGFAMYLLKNGVRLDTIQVLMGHANVAVTQVYAYQDVDDVQSQVDGLFDCIA